MSSEPSVSERPDTGGGQVVFEDGLGLRIRDEKAGDLVERLVVCQELMRFESALRDRMGRLANFRHVRYPRVRAVERAGSGDDQTVSVVTDAVKGHRLSALLDAAEAHDLVIEVNAALQVARELLPALSVLHDSRNVTHGAIGPERIVLATEGRIVIVDHTVGLALERLRFPRSRLWREFRIAMPPSAGLPQVDQRADVAQVAMVVLALVLGRHIGAREFPDGLRTLATEAPERLGGGAVRPMTASLRAWFERALPLESRRPFATALEAQIALESVVTREVAYSPRPGTLRTLLHRYEELCGNGDGAGGEPIRRRPDAASAAGHWGAAGSGSEGARPTSPTRRRAFAKGRKALTPEELEAQEIARLEAELARLMSLENQDESGAPAEPALGRVVPFPGQSEGLAEPPAVVTAPVDAGTEPASVDVPSPPAAASDFAGPAADAVEFEPPLGEEEIAALSALIEIETRAGAPQDARAAAGGEHVHAPRREDVDSTDAELEVDLDAALEELITDAFRGVPTDVPVWIVDTTEAIATAEVVEPDADAWSLTPLGEDDAMVLARQAGAEAAAGAEQPARDELTRTLDYEAPPEHVALAFVQPYHRRLAASLPAGRPLTTADVARVLSLVPRVVEVDPAKALPLKRQPAPRRPAALAGAPEPVGALASNATGVFATLAVYSPAGALVAPAALVAEAAEQPATLAADLALIGTLAEPLHFWLFEAEVPVAEDAGTSDIGLLLRAAVDVVEPSALEAVATTDVAPPVDVETTAAVEVVAPAEVPAVVDAELTLQAVVDGVEPSALEAVATTDVAPPVDVETTAAVEVVAPAEVPAVVYAELTLQAVVDEVEASALEAVATDVAPPVDVETTAAVDAVVDVTCEVDAAAAHAARPEPVAREVVSDEPAAAAVIAPEVVLDSSAGSVFEASAEQPVEEVTEVLAPETVAEPAAVTPEVESAQIGSREEGAGRAKRRKRRRRKTKRAQREAMPGPVEVAPPQRSPDPVDKPMAPWLRGRDLASAPPRPAPTVVSPPLPAPISPISTAPPWTRRGREPLPVLPSAEGSQIGEVALTPPVAAVGDALSPQESIDQSTTVAAPDVPKPVPSTPPAPPSGEPVAQEAPVEQPRERGGHVLSFPARHPRMSINWRRTIAASIVIMLIESGAFATAYWYVRPREVGYLLVSSTVTGLDVSIDGHVLGKTPLSLELPPGRHTIEMRGYGATKTVPVEIAPNVQTSQMVAWPRPPEVGRLSLKTTPGGAQVSLDGEPRGVAPLTIEGLAPGTHQIVVQNESGSVEQTVRIVADETLEIDVPIYSGWLALFAPVEVRIFEDGKLLGTSLDGRILMPPGRHRLELVNQRLGYRQTRDVVIQPGRVVGVSVEAPRGTLVVEAPAGTSVSVDGEAMGVTPLGELSVEVGTREIFFQHPELGQRRVTVTVGVGSPARANMLAPR